ncbi:MAG TPA: hypothetical protein VKT75_10600 [Acidobacteriaceae bacterium]|nr:hypothetical protein [Acidobacteriaceae bacterium]
MDNKLHRRSFFSALFGAPAAASILAEAAPSSTTLTSAPSGSTTSVKVPPSKPVTLPIDEAKEAVRHAMRIVGALGPGHRPSSDEESEALDVLNMILRRDPPLADPTERLTLIHLLASELQPRYTPTQNGWYGEPLLASYAEASVYLATAPPVGANEEAELEQFYRGNQWPAEIRGQRSQQGRPSLTINMLPTIVRAITAATPGELTPQEHRRLTLAVTKQNRDAQRCYNYIASERCERRMVRGCITRAEKAS